MSSYTHARDRYVSAEATIRRDFPSLETDPDIAQALITIRNAERAIAARVDELDEDDE